MQKSLELRNPLVEAISCLQPEQRTKAASVQKIRVLCSYLPSVKSEELIPLTDEWRIYAEIDISQDWILKEDGSVARVDHYWNKVLQLKTQLGSQRFSVLAKAVKCALTLSHGNADNERSLSVNKKALTKGRASLSTTTLNGLRATGDGIKSVNGLSNTSVTKAMLCCVKDSHKAYLKHMEIERKKEVKKKSTSREGEEVKKKQEEEIRKVEKLKSSVKTLHDRVSRAEQMLQSASGFLQEGDRRMAKGLAEKDMDEIEAAQKIIQLAHEKQKKAQDELQIVHQEKRKLTDKLGEKASKKVKAK